MVASSYSKACEWCQAVFQTRRPEQRYCSRACGASKKTVYVHCERCATRFAAHDGKRFCSKSCSAAQNNKNRTHSDETRKKISRGVLANPGKKVQRRKPNLSQKVVILRQSYESNPRKCKLCDNDLPYKRRWSETCGCYKRGGYREGSSRSKHGRFRGIWCDSLYELCFLIYHLDNKIPIERNTTKFSYYFDDSPHSYLPDFRVRGVLHEIKGFDSPKHQAKLLAVNEPITCTLGAQNFPYIAYVMTKYCLPYSRLPELYEMAGPTGSAPVTSGLTNQRSD